jgi:hypothetical protein
MFSMGMSGLDFVAGRDEDEHQDEKAEREREKKKIDHKLLS